MKQFPMDIIEQLLLDVHSGTKKREIELIEWRIKVYHVNSSAKYAFPSIRVDIQDLELTEY